MDNQHRKIVGYRELTQEEIDLMNRIKSMGIELDKLVSDVDNYISAQYGAAFHDEKFSNNTHLADHLKASNPLEWSEQGKHDLQTGLMKLTRSVAQPEFF